MPASPEPKAYNRPDPLTGGNIHFTGCSSSDAQVAYTVMYADYSAEVTKDHTLEETFSVIREGTERMYGRLKQDGAASIAGRSGWELAYDHEGRHYHMQFVFDGSRGYFLLVSYPIGASPAGDDRFFNSFQLAS
jgi:hypothetical protein